MSLQRLHDGLKTILADHGKDILNDTRKTKAFLHDYTGDESREEVKLLLLLLSNNVHLDILKEKEFDSQTQQQFIRNISAKYPSANYDMGLAVAGVLFLAFYDSGLLKINEKAVQRSTGIPAPPRHKVPKLVLTTAKSSVPGAIM
jgi:hypothetical protein